MLATLLKVRLEDGRTVAVLDDERLIIVSDMMNETKERLEFRDPVVKLSLGGCHQL